MVQFTGEIHCSVNHDDFLGAKGAENQMRAKLWTRADGFKRLNISA